MRLIDADALLPKVVYYVNKNSPLLRVDKLLERIEKAPTIDAVPVVRCGECKNGTVCVNMKGTEYVDCVLDDYSVRKPTDFCSYGERRSDA